MKQIRICEVGIDWGLGFVGFWQKRLWPLPMGAWRHRSFGECQSVLCAMTSMYSSLILLLYKGVFGFSSSKIQGKRKSEATVTFVIRKHFCFGKFSKPVSLIKIIFYYLNNKTLFKNLNIKNNIILSHSYTNLYWNKPLFKKNKKKLIFLFKNKFDKIYSKTKNIKLEN